MEAEVKKDPFLRLAMLIGVVILLALMIWFAISTIGNFANEYREQTATIESNRLALVSEEVEVSVKNIVEEDPFFQSYYEYQTSNGLYRVVFEDNFTTIKSIVKVE